MPPTHEGFRMIESLTIENFRGLGKIALSGLSRINVIVGPNASGKTALLEALLLGCRASPQAALAMWQGRAQTNVVPAGVPGFRAIWSGFFPNLDMRHTINIEYTDSNVGKRGLKIGSAVSPPLIAGQGSRVVVQPLNSGTAEVTAINFERKINRSGQTQTARSYIGPQGHLVADSADPIGPAAAMFPAFNPSNESDNVTWLSQLSLANKEHEALTLLKQEFPYIESLDVLSPAGIQGIFVSYKGSRNKLPISIVSSGIHKVLTIILASLSYERGIILIDELENGIFYRRYTDLWALIHQLAVSRENQLFVTSHSLECLTAALPIVQKRPQDFTLIRMERASDGTVAKMFSGVEFAAALEQDVDPRGGELIQ